MMLTAQSVPAPGFWVAFRAYRSPLSPECPHVRAARPDRFATWTCRTCARSPRPADGSYRTPVRRWPCSAQARGCDLDVMYGATEATAGWPICPRLLLRLLRAIGMPIPGGCSPSSRCPSVRSPGRGEAAGGGRAGFHGANVMLGFAGVLGGPGPRPHRRGCVPATWPSRDAEQVEDRRPTSRITKVFGLRIDLDQVDGCSPRTGWWPPPPTEASARARGLLAAAGRRCAGDRGGGVRNDVRFHQGNVYCSTVLSSRLRRIAQRATHKSSPPAISPRR